MSKHNPPSPLDVLSQKLHDEINGRRQDIKKFAKQGIDTTTWCSYVRGLEAALRFLKDTKMSSKA